MPPLFPAVTAQTSWRQAEAALFQVMARMEDGWIPTLQPNLSPSDLRRLGYLAEMVARFRRPATRQQLLTFANQALAATLRDRDADPAVEAIVPRGTAGNAPQDDALAEKWRFCPGIDLARYASETGRQWVTHGATLSHHAPPTHGN